MAVGKEAESSSEVLPAALPTLCLLPSASCLLSPAYCLLPSAFSSSRDACETYDSPRAFGYGNVVFILEIAVGKQA